MPRSRPLGGGAHGAYEAGVLWGLIKEAKNKKDFEYDVITGVSAGSINALASSTFPKGDEEAMVEYLSTTWQNLTNPDVYIDWLPDGVVTGVAPGRVVIRAIALVGGEEGVAQVTINFVPEDDLPFYEKWKGDPLVERLRFRVGRVPGESHEEEGRRLTEVAEWLVESGLLDPARRREVEEPLLSTWLARLRDGGPPVARIGDSIFVYRVP